MTLSGGGVARDSDPAPQPLGIDGYRPGMFATALLMLLGIGFAIALRAANQPRLAKVVGLTLGVVCAGFAALITFGLLFGD